MNRRGFTLFEVLIALGVFSIAVTGLAIALQSAVESGLAARERMLARVIIESRLAAAMADPPLDGKRETEGSKNNGIAVLEEFEPVEILNTNGAVLPGMWKLSVTAKLKRAGIDERAEILIYRQ